MKNVGSNLGMTVPPPLRSISDNSRGRLRENDIDKYLMDFGRNGVRLVIVVLSNSPDIYGKY